MSEDLGPGQDWVLAGLSHKTAAPKLREPLAAGDPRNILKTLRTEGFKEVLVLSTCNRFEVYASPRDGRDPASEGAALSGFLEKTAGRPIAAGVYRASGLDAVLHLFEVASGLDSLVVGETEILGQVKDAYLLAKSEGAMGKFGNVLFQRALFVGKRARAETKIAVGPTSVASAAARLAGSIFGGMEGRSVLILGAGAMAQLLAGHLRERNVAKLMIANRTLDRAEELASRMQGEAIPWEEFPRAMAEADIVIASTASKDPIVTRSMVREVLVRRRGRGTASFFIIDISMPRNVEEAVHGIDEVFLYRLEDLEGIVAESLKNRESEVVRARAFVREKAVEFCTWLESVRSGRERSLRHA